MALLTKADFLKHRPISTRTVHALGGRVRLKAMTACEKDLFEQSWLEFKGEGEEVPNVRAFFVIHHVVDENDKLLFTIDDLEAVGNQPGVEIDKIFTAAQELSGLSDEDEEELKKK